jgi:hypothetical protein
LINSDDVAIVDESTVRICFGDINVRRRKENRRTKDAKIIRVAKK